MKKKIIILLLLLSITILSSCSKKEENKESENNMEPNVKIIEQNDNGDITKGTIEGYTFTETDDKTDRVKIQMEDGSVILAVLSNKSTPITIANFKKLISEHFYDGIIFHRVIENFMIQGGDPTGTGYSGSDETIKGEFLANGVANSMSHERGVLSMARSSAMDSASSQFFIMHADYPSLDGQYASFGKVFAGMDEVDKIATTKVDGNDKPIEEQKIHSIRFINIEEA